MLQGLPLLMLLPLPAHAAKLIFPDDFTICCEFPEPPPLFVVVEPPLRSPDLAQMPARGRRAMIRFERDGDTDRLLARLGDSPEERWARLVVMRRVAIDRWMTAIPPWQAMVEANPETAPEMPLWDPSPLRDLAPGPLMLAAVALDPRSTGYDEVAAGPLLQALAADGDPAVATWARFLLADRAFDDNRFEAVRTLLPAQGSVPDGPMRHAIAFYEAWWLEKLGRTDAAADAWAHIEGSLQPVARVHLLKTLAELSLDTKQTYLEVALAHLGRHPTEDAGALLAELALWLEGYPSSDVLPIADAALARGLTPAQQIRVERFRLDTLASGVAPRTPVEAADRAFLRKYADKNADSAWRCAELAQWPAEAVTVQFAFDPGKPAHVDAVGELGTCLAAAAATWWFPQNMQGTSTAIWLFVPYR